MTRSTPSSARVAIACGGTGGHLFPGLAVAQQLMAQGASVSLLISPKAVDQEAVKSLRGMAIITLPAAAWQSGSRLACLRGFAQSWVEVRKQFRAQSPDAVLGMGGFTSAAPILVGRRRGAKTFLHESNSVPGRANRWLARRVDHAFIGFPQAAAQLHAPEITATGTPVRAEFRPRDAGACRAALGFDPVRPLVLIMGGSQGASALNDLVCAVLPQMATRLPRAQWLHLTGPRDVEKVRAAYTRLNLAAVVKPFLQEMEQVLGAATAAVSRAGASSLAELAALRLPAVLVPFPQAADNHQWHNARALAETGAAFLLEQAGATPERLLTLIAGLLEDTGSREKMQTALAGWHSPRAAEQIAGNILKTLAEHASLTSRLQGAPKEDGPVKLSAIT